MEYPILIVALGVFATSLLVLWRSRVQALTRQAHLFLSVGGHLLVTHAAVAALVGPEVSTQAWWRVELLVGLSCSLAGMGRLLWFMWLRNGSLSHD